MSLDDAGMLILSGSNGYTGGTFVNAGTLVVENPNGIPNGSSLTVGGAASLFASPAGGSVVFGGAEVIVAGGNSAAAPSAVPEPGTLALLLAGLAIAALCRRIRRR